MEQAKTLLMSIELDLGIEAALDESPVTARRRVLAAIAAAFDKETSCISRLDATVYDKDGDEVLSLEDGRRHDRNDGVSFPVFEAEVIGVECAECGAACGDPHHPDCGSAE